ncbi:MAG: hypothetical protein ACR2QH_01370 [Geminicoccaceae bacterium]
MTDLGFSLDQAGRPLEVTVPDRISSLLIAGTSHTGKSTFASLIGQSLGWSIFSTDQLARHPGRPWPKVAPHIAEYYSRLSAESIYQFLLHHHENMWPGIRRLVSENRDQDIRFVLEGSALRPEYIATLKLDETAVVYFYADHDFLRGRMHSESRYDDLDESHQTAVDKFINRSLRDNDEQLATARSHRLACIDVRDATAVEQFVLAIISSGSG